MFLAWKYCRTCMANSALVPIFKDTENPRDFVEKLNHITGLNVETNDKLPQQICSECVDMVNSVYKWRDKCLSVHGILLTKLADTKPYESLERSNSPFGDSSDDEPISYKLKKNLVKKESEIKCEPTCEEISFETTVENVLNSRSEIQFENLKPFEKSEVLIKLEKPPKRKPLIVKKEVPTVVIDGATKYKCRDCLKLYNTWNSYLNHSKVHTGKKIICEHCGKVFLKKSRLLEHCRARHGYKKINKCSYCDYEAINVESIKIHERLHTGEKPYACELCDARFHRKSSYRQHKPIHNAEKTVQCDHCPLLFKSFALMRIHKSKYKQRQYKFKCLVCGSFLAKKQHCHKHLQKIHGIGENLPSYVQRMHLSEIEKSVQRHLTGS